MVALIFVSFFLKLRWGGGGGEGGGSTTESIICFL